MYAAARRGEVKGFTGIDDPYEAPVDPEITLDTVNVAVEENARRILDVIQEKGFVRPAAVCGPGCPGRRLRHLTRPDRRWFHDGGEPAPLLEAVQWT